MPPVTLSNQNNKEEEVVESVVYQGPIFNTGELEGVEFGVVLEDCKFIPTLDFVLV